MNRKDFLKNLSLALAAVAFPAIPGIKPSLKEQGRGIIMATRGLNNKNALSLLKEHSGILKDQIVRAGLRPGQKYQLSIDWSHDWGQFVSIQWHAGPSIEKLKVTGFIESSSNLGVFKV